jgi:23S rRNA (cytidine1920-2'-O)/16S rRNA (cytidine1409-2'-O)-methyltransferase
MAPKTSPNMNSPPTRIRLDRLLVVQGYTRTRQKAQALILAGRVLVNCQKVNKSGTAVASDSTIEILGQQTGFVGRGGLKLEGALERLGWKTAWPMALDIGSSTGGFVDCLLQRGTARIIAVDAGTNQLDWKLRSDTRVRVLERTNARYLKWKQIGETADLITMDVSFISTTLILPAIVKFARPGTRLLILVKPQFEVTREQVGKGGIVRDPVLHEQSVSRVLACMSGLGFVVLDSFPAAIRGAEGNQEFFLAAEFPVDGTKTAGGPYDFSLSFGTGTESP